MSRKSRTNGNPITHTWRDVDAAACRDTIIDMPRTQCKEAADGVPETKLIDLSKLSIRESIPKLFTTNCVSHDRVMTADQNAVVTDPLISVDVVRGD
ncbi:jg27246 [Pararge aegeria aegeria]|uniref:Jg27246 protein n=1 Tax=Pararge aegeria aegeria TaxID=348720 RepID=A0A8S4RR40_9NEOP|nr:jg27246 [Pararge aegeria aegeria]